MKKNEDIDWAWVEYCAVAICEHACSLKKGTGEEWEKARIARHLKDMAKRIGFELVESRKPPQAGFSFDFE